MSRYGWVPVADVVDGIEADTVTEMRLRSEDGRRLPFLVWRLAEPMTVASTAASGGGVGTRQWVINAQVARNYRRRDLDEHGAELAAAAGVTGPGVVMFTAADVRKVQAVQDGAVSVAATVGLTHPIWAADADDEPAAALPGTINIVAFMPVRLEPAALLNALCTATEAKTQALLDAGVPGTGTASDAVTIACPADGRAESFAGPRSTWGARLARAVHAAVRAGAAR